MANPPKGKAKAKPAAAKKPAPRSGKTATSRAKAKPVDSGQTYVVSGTVTYADSTPAAGLTVIAYDQDMSGKDNLGQPVVTTESGAFSIPYSDADFRRTKEERGGADVIVCIYNAEKELLFTSKKQNNAPAKYEVNITVPKKPFVIRGKVTGANQQPLANMRVRADWRDLRHPWRIGAATTDKIGEYRIEYYPEDLPLGDTAKRSVPWLIVEVLGTEEGAVLAKQEVQRAERDQLVSFSLAQIGAVSEWQRLSEAIMPRLKGQGADLAKTGPGSGKARGDLAPYDITVSDIDFFVRDTGLDRTALEAWVASSKMLRDAMLSLSDEHAAQRNALHDYGWPFFYSLARQLQSRDLEAALRESAEKLQQAWQAARAVNRVSELAEAQVQSVVEALQLLQRLQQLDPTRSGNGEFARVLASNPLPKVVALAALSISQEKGLVDVDALLKLAEKYPDAEASINTFVRGLRVHQLVSGQEGLAGLLNARLQGTSDSIAPLAAMSAAEWISVADKASTNPGQALRMLAHVEKQHPLTALKAKIDSGELKLPGVSSKDLSVLIKNQGKSVDALLRGSKVAKDPGVTEESAAHKMLQDVGRFVRTGVNMELAGHLIGAGVTTPAVAVRYGRDTVREMARELYAEEAALEVVDGLFETVEPVLAGANGFLIDVALNKRAPAFMREKDTQPASSAAIAKLGSENLPTIPGLFGDLDECICRPCESMLGQPAYLVDLLNLLGKIQPDFSTLDSRRPDIREMELSCEMAEKTIQHIDIVLEILQTAAGADPDLKIAGAIYPWRLPFSLPYAKTKACLSKLGKSRFDLLSLRSNPQDNQLAAETLDLTVAQTSVAQVAISEWQLLTEQRTGTALWAVYGFDIEDDIAIADPASGEQLYNQTVQDLLTRVSFLIDRTGLELDELEQTFKTEFVAGFQGGFRFSNRDQCKTSEMRLPAEGPVLEECLDRLHRFTRLHAKLPGWSITQLNRAIVACGGMETGPTADTDRANLLVKLATLKRLHDDHGIPLEHLLDLPASTERFRKSLGLTGLQFSLLKTVTALDLTVSLFTWAALENFCNAAKRIRESGLSVEQMAQALLPRSELVRLAGELPPSFKTTEEIEKLLTAVQKRLRSVVANRPDQTLESQAIEALSEVYDAATADKLVNAIRDATAEEVSDRAEHPVLLPLLHGDATSRSGRKLGEWLPLMDVPLAEKILMLASNLDAKDRFSNLLEGFAARRRERELIAVIAEQCGLAESEVIPLLGARLLLDASTPAGTDFLSSGFWADTATNPPRVPSVTATAVRQLHAWMDRLYRLISLSTALKIDGELMQLADRIAVGTTTGINWRDIRATLPATGSAWSNPNWQALLDMLWLQQPEQLSRPVFIELSGKLATLAQNGTQIVTTDTNAVRPLATRLEIADAQILDIAAQAITVTTDNLRDPSQLRRVFELLLLARQLGASDTQLSQLANPSDNAQAATTAEGLLEARVGDDERKKVLQTINDKLRQQRRDALVAYLIHREPNDALSSANDLYERYLIDPQMEPCFETTRLLEAITATQLFVQRILFGLEPGIRPPDSVESDGIKQLRQRWTWMRNYRVWEANRKVFLFPENWLFPELRDDKSSSFKQLESALGQGELNQDLANQSFGQFLDDVAQMGQIKVLGMYEDVARVSTGILLDSQRFPLRRILYAVGRTQNPPYAYFWRRCVDFGSPHMEWAPWQRIELDVQGDHVMPFVLGGELHVAWPLIRNIKGDSKDIKDEWEAKLAWSRHDGKSWRKSSISRDFWRAEAQPFSDERESFSLRCETSLLGDSAKIFLYALAKIPGSLKTKLPSDMGPLQEFVFNDTTHYPSSASDVLEISNLVTAITSVAPHTVLVDTLEKFRHHYAALPDAIRNHIEVYWMTYGYWRRRPDPYTLHGGSAGYGTLNGNGTVFNDPFFATNFHLNTLITYPGFITDVEFLDDIRSLLSDYLDKYLTLRIGDFSNFMTSLKAACSRRVIFCYVWIRVKTPSGAADDLLPLDGSKGIFSCVIEGVNLTPRQHRDITKLGGQAEATYGLTLTVGTRTLPSTTNETLAAVPAGNLANQKLKFEIDGRGLTKTELEELGINFDSLRTLALVSEFRLTRDDSVAVLFGDLLQGNGATLGKWVDSSQLWMNGYKEIETNPPLPLKIIISQGNEVPIFDSWGPGPFSPPSPFWAVGTASSQPYTMFPLAWHCSENGISRYVDLGHVAGLANNGLFVYPDSYKEATVRRSYWSEYQALEALPAEQLSNFSANEAPLIAANLQTTDWTDVAGGLLAFNARMPYACYNWEVFFHAPLLIADQLSKQHKFEDAEQWLRYVFDPTSGGPETDAKRFLKFRVFKKLDLSKQVIDDLTALVQAAGGFATVADIAAVEKLINRWRDAPFRPFLIARRRHIAFLWRTLFAYLDNLIAWADSLYRRDTIESINEATMLYVLAERILGRRPQLHTDKSNVGAISYKDMTSRWDEFANFWIDAGTLNVNGTVTVPPRPQNSPQPNNDAGALYFCMPFNDKILSYWNTIEARLSNVRNCRNIEGIERKLPLMDAPIDPELLIRATAAGLDLGDVIAGLYAPPPHYRYSILSARAAELANEAKSLGAAMLSAIEKRDAEHLAKLRSSNEISLLKLVSEVRKLQITEADRNIDALRASRKSIGTRYNQYQRLLGNKDADAPDEGKSAGEESILGRVGDGTSGLSHLGLIDAENKHIEDLDIAYGWTVAGGVTKGVAGAAHMSAGIVRANSAGAASVASEVLTSIGTGLSTVGDMFDMVSRGWQHSANRQSILGGHLRRRDEWAFQSNQTLKELQQIDKQILANQIRIDITNKELNNHIEQIEQSKAVDEVMRSKFSNAQLYEWMKTELSKLYFSAYRMALEMARKAERAAARELGVKPLNILGNAYWDSLRDGLLAGERLHQDLKRLEITYLDQNRREYELTKHISLRRLDPKALVKLRAKDSNGRCRCEFKIPEWLFDLDTPGHYLRRIKSVSVSIPSVTGPYTSVSCKLTLLKSEVRHEGSANAYARLPSGDDPRFTDYYGASEAIVTSTGNGDSGLFETNLRDERFLPFEGSGVISEWRLELPDAYPQFDYSTISDVVLSIRYTAREGGDLLRTAATSAIASLLDPTLLSPAVTPAPDPLLFPVVLSCRSDFPTEWARAKTLVPGGTQPPLVIPITRSLLPYWMDAIRVGTAKLTVQKVEFVDLLRDQTASSFTPVPRLTSGNNTNPVPNYALEANDEGTGNLGTLLVDVVDRVVVLYIGKQTVSS